MQVKNFFDYCDAIKILNEWGDAYAQGAPKVTDAIYDELYKQVVQFEKLFPDMVDKDSPTRKIHSDTTDGFIKVTHLLPMLSIQNSNGYEELEDFLKGIWNKGVNQVTIENKIDGLSLSLHYENGKLVDAVTRGNGVQGDSVLANALRIKSIPKDLGTFTGEIRGECVLLLDNFDKLYKRIEEETGKQLANPRNACSGSLKLHDPDEVERRNLDFIAYSVVRGSSRPRHSDDLLVLKSHGFLISDYHVCNSIKETMEAARNMELLRSDLAFLTDGLVVKVNDKKAQDNLGVAGKYPRYYTALKFPPEVKETEMIEIEKSYGRTGACTPVLIIKPVKLAGTTVNRASLHNWDILEYLGLYKGCKIKIQKAGEIIPECVGVVGFDRTKIDYEVASSSGKIELVKAINELRKLHAGKDFIKRPTHCDHCKTPLINPTNIKGEVLVVLECPNDVCPVKQFRNIIRFCEKESMNIFGLDEGIIEKLLSNGLIKNITDLYSLKKDDIQSLEGFGERSAEKIVAAIYASKNNYLHQLLIGFGIENCGKTLSPKLADKFETLVRFSNMTEADLNGIEDVGPETKKSILTWVKKNRDIMNFFIANNIACKAKEGLKVLSNKLSGKTMIMTGTSDLVGRDDFKTMVKQHGGKVVGSISSKVSYVLVGESAGPDKMKKISELQKAGNPIKIITDDEFLQMIK